MLTITAEAAEAIRVVRDALELPDSAGLRISTAQQSMNGTGPSYAVELAPEPADEDEVVEDDGAHVFVDPAARPTLDDKQLDADIKGGGEVRFSLRDQS
jgi:iron-sulfur cluster assembly protein